MLQCDGHHRTARHVETCVNVRDIRRQYATHRLCGGVERRNQRKSTNGGMHGNAHRFVLRVSTSVNRNFRPTHHRVAEHRGSSVVRMPLKGRGQLDHLGVVKRKTRKPIRRSNTSNSGSSKASDTKIKPHKGSWGAP